MSALLVASCTMSPQFYDIDAMQVVWHGNYPRFFEEARSALLDMIGYNYTEMQESGYLWPIVDMRIKYISPLRLHQKLIVEAALIEYENRLKIEYRIFDSHTKVVLTRGYTIQVAVKCGHETMDFEAPEIFIEKVRKVLL